MSRSVTLRALVAGASCALIACGDRRTPQTDTSAGQVGVIDSAPASVATAVAAMLTDENVFALLDTAFAAMIATDRMAQGKTEGAVNGERVQRLIDDLGQVRQCSREARRQSPRFDLA